MSDPRRLLSGASNASALERRLLGAGRLRREPEGMHDRVLLGLGAAVSAGALSTTAATAKAKAGTTTAMSAATKATTLTGSVLAKTKIVVLAAALVTAAGTTTYVAMNEATNARTTSVAPVLPTSVTPPPPASAPSEPATSTIPTAAASDLPSAAPVATAGVQRARPTATARRADLAPPIDPPEKASAPSIAASELREEAALVDDARSALASGDFVAARDRLARADARFPHGRLGEEREALAVRVAAAAGDPAHASRLARAFLQRHPTSPLRPSMESIAKKSAIE